jgi:alkanesulfonate monooxygenase SsuD/methylene tetrahydromethanopterin reductase-like flavin-dependent oxidoreductase (luciferase family)
MSVTLHWFLPTSGDSRSDLSLGNAVGAQGSRVLEGGRERAPDIGYIAQIASAAEQLGFVAALTPTSSWCEEAWVFTAALTQLTRTFKYLVALEVAGRCADVYLTWGEPPDAVAEKLERASEQAEKYERRLRFGIRLHAIARDTAEEAWAEANRLLAGLAPEAIERAQATQRASQSEGQRRMVELHGGRTDALEVSPNLWAGVGLVRGGAGTALVGSHEEVADRIADYHELGIDEFILSGYPHLEEAYRVGEGVMPILRRRGLLASETPDHKTVEV